MMWRSGVSLFMLMALVSCASSTSGESDTGIQQDAVSDLDGLNPDGRVDDAEPQDQIEDPNGDTGKDGKPGDATPDGKDIPLPDVQPELIPDTQDVEPDVPVIENLQIEIVEPTGAGPFRGSIRVKVIPVGLAELKVDNVSVYINDKFSFNDKKLPTEFVLDSMTKPGTELKIKANAYLGDLVATDEVVVPLDNPSFRFKRVHPRSPVYKNGDMLYLHVNTGKTGMTLSADLSAMDSTWEPGKELVQESVQGQYLITHRISADNTRSDGPARVVLTASDGLHDMQYRGVELILQNQPLNPLYFRGGIFVPGSMPPSSDNWTQPISLVFGNEFIITGGSAKVNVDFGGYAHPEEIVGLIFGLDGYYGYYQVPLEDSLGEEEILVLMRKFVGNEVPPANLALKIAARDVRGRISPYRTRNLSVQNVGSGDVQVSISWDTNDDVDLHVVDPFGCEMYYGRKNCPPGWLDLDSNPACNIDGINNENVFWPPGQAPNGTFIVRVDFWEDCVQQGPNYTVTLHYCGDIEVIEGHFAPGTDDGGGAGSGVTVAQFSNENCGRILRGTVRYEDRTFDETGFTAATWKPVRYAQVEVRRLDGGGLLATGYTDRWGRYEIQFNNKLTPGIYLVVKSVTNIEEGLRKITVMNHPKFKQIYSVVSPSIDESLTEFPELDFDIPEVIGAGAFNILDVTGMGYDMVRLMTGRNLGDLFVFWATGADTTDTLFCSEFFYNQGSCSELMALSVQGKEIDRDEYDDMVILKEFFKFALARVTRDDNPGGAHYGTREDPRLSWSEGVSTFFASSALNSRYFVNGRPDGVYDVFDLETMDSPFAFKTSTGGQSGKVSNYLISSVLWDLFDAADDEDLDTIEGMTQAVFDSVFHYFDGSSFVDRGFPGVDLVDFLDGWFCRGWGEKPGLEAILQERQFPYDFGGPANCL